MEPEVVMNLWVFTQSMGPSALFPDIDQGWAIPLAEQGHVKMDVIYELGVRPYVMSGSDDEMTRLLKELAPCDFHFARRFPLPDRYYLAASVEDGVFRASSGDTMPTDKKVRKGLALVRPDISGMLQIEYFKEALDVVENCLPTRRIGIKGFESSKPRVNRKNLLSVITTVRVDAEGNQVAEVDDPRRHESPSVVTNLWVLQDKRANMLYGVSGRGYVIDGSDSKKSRILKALAPYDFAMAKTAPIPERFAPAVGDKIWNGHLAVPADNKYDKELFGDVFGEIEQELTKPIGVGGKINRSVPISARIGFSIASSLIEDTAKLAEVAPIKVVEAIASTNATLEVPSRDNRPQAARSSPDAEITANIASEKSAIALRKEAVAEYQMRFGGTYTLQFITKEIEKTTLSIVPDGIEGWEENKKQEQAFRTDRSFNAFRECASVFEQTIKNIRGLEEVLPLALNDTRRQEINLALQRARRNLELLEFSCVQPTEEDICIDGGFRAVHNAQIFMQMYRDTNEAVEYLRTAIAKFQQASGPRSDPKRLELLSDYQNQASRELETLLGTMAPAVVTEVPKAAEETKLSGDDDAQGETSSNEAMSVASLNEVTSSKSRRSLFARFAGLFHYRSEATARPSDLTVPVSRSLPPVAPPAVLEPSPPNLAEDLTDSASRGDAVVVQALLAAGAEVNAKTDDGRTALILASQNGHPEVVRVLLDRGADVNAQSNDGRTALFQASLLGDHEVVQVLLDRGAVVDAKPSGLGTALFHASQNGHREVVRVLLDRGADVNAKSDDGRTALMIASERGHREVVQALLDKGADVNAKGSTGLTAFMVAAGEGRADVRALLVQAGASSVERSSGYIISRQELSSTGTHANLAPPSANSAAYSTSLTVQLETFGEGVTIELRRGVPGTSQVVDSQKSSGGNVYFRQLCRGSYFMAIGNEDTVSVTPVRQFEDNANYQSRIVVQRGSGNVTRQSRSRL